MSRILPRVVLMACVALVSSSALAKSLEEIASPEQLLELLGQARSVRVEGNHTWTPVVQYPVVLLDPVEIRRFADFFRQAELLPDETSTRFFRGGGIIFASEVTRIIIDEKLSFSLLSHDRVAFADSLSYRGLGTPGPLWSSFHYDFAQHLAKIVKPSRKSKGSRKR